MFVEESINWLAEIFLVQKFWMLVFGKKCWSEKSSSETRLSNFHPSSGGPSLLRKITRSWPRTRSRKAYLNWRSVIRLTRLAFRLLQCLYLPAGIGELLQSKALQSWDRPNQTIIWYCWRLCQRSESIYLVNSLWFQIFHAQWRSGACFVVVVSLSLIIGYYFTPRLVLRFTLSYSSNFLILDSRRPDESAQTWNEKRRKSLIYRYSECYDSWKNGILNSFHFPMALIDSTFSITLKNSIVVIKWYTLKFLNWYRLMSFYPHFVYYPRNLPSLEAPKHHLRRKRAFLFDKLAILLFVCLFCSYSSLFVASTWREPNLSSPSFSVSAPREVTQQVLSLFISL